MSKGNDDWLGRFIIIVLVIGAVLLFIFGIFVAIILPVVLSFIKILGIIALIVGGIGSFAKIFDSNIPNFFVYSFFIGLILFLIGYGGGNYIYDLITNSSFFQEFI